MAAPQVIDAAMCERLVNAAVGACRAPVTAQPPPVVAAPASSQPNWDAMANAFASLSAAFTWGSLLLAVVALAAAGAWGYFVKIWAERTAKEEAAACVKKQMDDWLANQAPQIIRKHVDLLRDASLGGGDDDEAADEMGKEAG